MSVVVVGRTCSIADLFPSGSVQLLNPSELLSDDMQRTLGRRRSTPKGAFLSVRYSFSS